MPYLDSARRVGGLVWLVAGLSFQLIWFLGRDLVPGLVTLVLCGSFAVLGLVILTRKPGWTRLGGWLAAVLLGLDFAGGVADRFGVLGSPGEPGVS